MKTQKNEIENLKKQETERKNVQNIINQDFIDKFSNLVVNEVEKKGYVNSLDLSQHYPYSNEIFAIFLLHIYKTADLIEKYRYKEEDISYYRPITTNELTSHGLYYKPLFFYPSSTVLFLKVIIIHKKNLRKKKWLTEIEEIVMNMDVPKFFDEAHK